MYTISTYNLRQTVVYVDCLVKQTCSTLYKVQTKLLEKKQTVTCQQKISCKNIKCCKRRHRSRHVSRTCLKQVVKYCTKACDTNKHVISKMKCTSKSEGWDQAEQFKLGQTRMHQQKYCQRGWFKSQFTVLMQATVETNAPLLGKRSSETGGEMFHLNLTE